jgi:hypothetical protein
MQAVLLPVFSIVPSNRSGKSKAMPRNAATENKGVL